MTPETLPLFSGVQEPAQVVDLGAYRSVADPAALADHELLAVMLAHPAGAHIAKALLARFGSLPGVFGATAIALERVAGMDRTLALRLRATHEATVRIARCQVAKRCVITSWTALLADAAIAKATGGQP